VYRPERGPGAAGPTLPIGLALGVHATCGNLQGDAGGRHVSSRSGRSALPDPLSMKGGRSGLTQVGEQDAASWGRIPRMAASEAPFQPPFRSARHVAPPAIRHSDTIWAARYPQTDSRSCRTARRPAATQPLSMPPSQPVTLAHSRRLTPGFSILSPWRPPVPPPARPCPPAELRHSPPTPMPAPGRAAGRAQFSRSLVKTRS
jgi:hypothetical protein